VFMCVVCLCVWCVYVCVSLVLQPKFTDIMELYSREKERERECVYSCVSLALQPKFAGATELLREKETEREREYVCVRKEWRVLCVHTWCLCVCVCAYVWLCVRVCVCVCMRVYMFYHRLIL